MVLSFARRAAGLLWPAAFASAPARRPAARPGLPGGRGYGLLLAGCLLAPGAVLAQTTDILVNQDAVPASASGPAGGTFHYVVTVRHNTGSAATGVVLTDKLPVGAVFQSVTTTPAGMACTPAITPGTAITVANQTVQCDLGSMAVNSTKVVDFEVVLPTVSTNWINNARVTRNETDSDPSNDALDRRITTTEAADLALAVTTNPTAPPGNPLSPGQPYRYVVDVSNQGPIGIPAAGRVEVMFSVPTGASFTRVGGSNGWTCTPTASNASPLVSPGAPTPATVVTCSYAGALANGGTVPSLEVDAAPNVTGSITTSFSVKGYKDASTEMPDGQTANNTGTAEVNVAGTASDVSVTKAVNGATTYGLNDQVTYTVTPRLNGGTLLTGVPVQVVDTLGAGLSFVSATGTGWTCSAAGQVITCDLPGGYAGANFSNLPAITVVALVQQTGTLPNTVTIDVPTRTDPDTTNNSPASVFITATNVADLQITKTASNYVNGQGVAVAIGQTYQYRLTARNRGPLAIAPAAATVPAAPSIVVSDSVPAGVTLTGLNAASGAGWTCSALPLVGPGTFTCERTAGLAVNANAPDIVVNAVRTTAGSATNNACVKFSPETGGTREDPWYTDPAHGINCQGVGVGASDQTPGNEVQADLSIVKSVDKPTVPAGDVLTYTMLVTNNGTSAATNVSLRDVLPSLVTSASAPGLVSVNTTAGTCTPSGASNVNTATLLCSLGTLNSGASATVTVAIRPTVATTATRTNTATAYSPEVVDPVLGNNTASVTSQVTARVDLVASKTVSPTPTAISGEPITYVVRARNNGPSSAENVWLRDVLPANGVLIGTPVASNGGVCDAVPPGNGGTLNCRWGTTGNSVFLANGGQYEVTYRLRAAGAWAPGVKLSNTVEIGTATDEPVLTNNQAAAEITLTQPELDILVSMAHSADAIALGAETTYTITVKNSGPSFGTNVVMTDTFPVTHPTNGASSATFGFTGGLTVDKGGVCTVPAIGATSGGVSCTFPGLAKDEVATITFKMKATSLPAGAASGTIFHRAVVSVSETEFLQGGQNTQVNNTTYDQTSTKRDPIATDLSILKAGPDGPIAPGADVDYTFTVRNNGNLTSNGAQVVDPLPAGLTFVSSSDCVAAGTSVTCSVGELLAGASRTLRVKTRLAQPYTGNGPLVNTATLDAPGDTDPTNNTSSKTTTVQPPPDAIASVPTLSQWALILLSCLLGGLALRQSHGPRRR
ncbi:IPTL-CTERM sorting domain-containing protein [Acidovorax sp. SUPP950]|uniref:IPTL-CTERM sorting domain-containing protein n=1 Tax=Acidovorax sp. SUPP950 TaxID=511901 RepID=UPI0023D54BDF|nr:IPTL-CTERM sorting domain-containing protein [Acidovorax sp. SUPP950]GKS75041.1 IPTL-CTERM sorting domain-containing protein [Acidovorax sp. SUPP950]